MVRETRHLWVGNIPETVGEARIRDHFKRFGLARLERVTEKACADFTFFTEESRTYEAILIFKTETSAEKALEDIPTFEGYSSDKAEARLIDQEEYDGTYKNHVDDRVRKKQKKVKSTTPPPTVTISRTSQIIAEQITASESKSPKLIRSLETVSKQELDINNGLAICASTSNREGHSRSSSSKLRHVLDASIHKKRRKNSIQSSSTSAISTSTKGTENNNTPNRTPKNTDKRNKKESFNFQPTLHKTISFDNGSYSKSPYVYQSQKTDSTSLKCNSAINVRYPPNGIVLQQRSVAPKSAYIKSTLPVKQIHDIHATKQKKQRNRDISNSTSKKDKSLTYANDNKSRNHVIMPTTNKPINSSKITLPLTNQSNNVDTYKITDTLKKIYFPNSYHTRRSIIYMALLIQCFGPGAMDIEDFTSKTKHDIEAAFTLATKLNYDIETSKLNEPQNRKNITPPSNMFTNSSTLLKSNNNDRSMAEPTHYIRKNIEPTSRRSATLSSNISTIHSKSISVPDALSSKSLSVAHKQVVETIRYRKCENSCHVPYSSKKSMKCAKLNHNLENVTNAKTKLSTTCEACKSVNYNILKTSNQNQLQSTKRALHDFEAKTQVKRIKIKCSIPPSDISSSSSTGPITPPTKLFSAELQHDETTIKHAEPNNNMKVSPSSKRSSKFTKLKLELRKKSEKLPKSNNDTTPLLVIRTTSKTSQQCATIHDSKSSKEHMKIHNICSVSIPTSSKLSQIVDWKSKKCGKQIQKSINDTTLPTAIFTTLEKSDDFNLKPFKDEGEIQKNSNDTTPPSALATSSKQSQKMFKLQPASNNDKNLKNKTTIKRKLNLRFQPTLIATRKQKNSVNPRSQNLKSYSLLDNRAVQPKSKRIALNNDKCYSDKLKKLHNGRRISMPPLSLAPEVYIPDTDIYSSLKLGSVSPASRSKMAAVLCESKAIINTSLYSTTTNPSARDGQTECCLAKLSSTEDLSPNYADRGATFYDRSNRVGATVVSAGVSVSDVVDQQQQQQYLRRQSSTSYQHTNIGQPGPSLSSASSASAASLVNNGSSGSGLCAASNSATGSGGPAGPGIGSGHSGTTGAGLGDLRGRNRDRVYRNGPFTPADRSNPVAMQRISSTSWYDNSNATCSSSNSRVPYGNAAINASCIGIGGNSNSGGSSDHMFDLSDRRSMSGGDTMDGGSGSSSNKSTTSFSVGQQLLHAKHKKKSKCGSESPGPGAAGLDEPAASIHPAAANCSGAAGGSAASASATSSTSVRDTVRSHDLLRGRSGSSRSQSLSPSSCRSTNSASSNSHHGSSSSPASGPDGCGASSRSRHPAAALLSGNNNPSSSANSTSSNPAVHSEDNRPLAICVRNLPSRSSDTSLKDGLFHEYKKHGKVTWVKVVGQHADRYALVCFKKADDVDKALEVSHDKLFFGCKIEVAPYQGYDVEDNEFRPYEAELDEYHPKSTRTLFIGNLEKDITASELRKHFDCFGEIIEIDIKKQGVNAYAFCQYSDIISVVAAMRKMDGEHLGANRIKLGFGKSMPTNCVWIDGLSDSVSDSHLTAQFNRFGPVSQTATDRERKLALVFFEQIQYAQTAVKEMRGVTLRSRKLQVDFASRECQDAFYDKLEKQGAGVVGPAGVTVVAGTVVAGVLPATLIGDALASIAAPVAGVTATSAVPVASLGAAAVNTNSSMFEGAASSSGAMAGNLLPAAGVAAGLQQRFNRFDTTRSRTSSFSRNSTSGAASPTSCLAGGMSATPIAGCSASGSTTPRGSGVSTGAIRRTRYPEFHESMDGCASGVAGAGLAGDGRRFKHYDEYSQGSSASHEDSADYVYCAKDRPESPVSSRLGGNSDVDCAAIAGLGAPTVNMSTRCRSERSPSAMDVDELYYRGGGSGANVQLRAMASPAAVLASSDGLSANPFALPDAIRNLQKERHQILEQLEECPSSGDEIVSPKKKMRIDGSSSSSGIDAPVQNNYLHHSHMQQQQQLSSSSHTHHINNHQHQHLNHNSNHHHHNHYNLHSNNPISDSNCDVMNNIDPNSTRKGVEIRRLSDCNNLQQSRQQLLNSNSIAAASAAASTASGAGACHRRPSAESAASVSSSSSVSMRQHEHQMHQHGTSQSSAHSFQQQQQQHVMGGGNNSSKRRRPGNSMSESSEHHSSRGRGHQLQSHHSHEASGGESADGSRPGTPLCDERPDNLLISTPSVATSSVLVIPGNNPACLHNYMARQSRECTDRTNPMYLPLPKFAHYPQSQSQHRSLFSVSNQSSALNSSLSSPPPALLTRPINQNVVSLTSAPTFTSQAAAAAAGASIASNNHHHYGEQPPASPSRAPSLSSNSSDSDVPSAAASANNSPSIEDRIRALDEMFEKWSDKNQSRKHHHSSSAYGDSTHGTANQTATSGHSFRHRFADLAKNKTPPPQSEIAKTLLTRKSVFDDDLKRLENIGDKYEPRDFSKFSRSSMFSSLSNTNNTNTTSTGENSGSISSVIQQQLSNAIPVIPATPAPPAPATPAPPQPPPPPSHQFPTNSHPAPPISTKVPAQLFQTPSALNQQHHQQRLNAAAAAAAAATAEKTAATAALTAAASALAAASPRNSPQPQSPYNSPAPSPLVVNSASNPVAAASGMANSIDSTSAAISNSTAVPIKGLQYPFPSHPPMPSTPTPPTSAPPLPPLPPSQPAAAPQPPPPQSQAAPPPQPPPPATPQEAPAPPPSSTAAANVSSRTSSKPKNNHQNVTPATATNPIAITKSISVSEVSPTAKSERPHVQKSASIPGSTNTGTVKAFTCKDEATTADAHAVSRRGSQEQTSRVKGDKHRNCSTETNAKTDVDRKKRPESLDRRKGSVQADRNSIEESVKQATSTDTSALAGGKDVKTDSESGDISVPTHRFRPDEERKERKERTSRQSSRSGHYHDDHGKSSSKRVAQSDANAMLARENTSTIDPPASTSSCAQTPVIIKREPVDEDTTNDEPAETSSNNANAERLCGKDTTINAFGMDVSSSKHNKENSPNSRENSPPRVNVDENHLAFKHREHNSPIRAIAKRRMSNQDSVESVNDVDGKRYKFGDNRKVLDSREFKDPNRASSNHRHHRHHSSSKQSSTSAATAAATLGTTAIASSVDAVANNSAECGENRPRKDSSAVGEEARRKEQRHRSKELDKSERNKYKEERSNSEQQMVSVGQGNERSRTDGVSDAMNVSQSHHTSSQRSSDEERHIKHFNKEKKLLDLAYEETCRQHNNKTPKSGMDSGANSNSEHTINQTTSVMQHHAQNHQQQRDREHHHHHRRSVSAGGGRGDGDNSSHTSSTKSSSERRSRLRKMDDSSADNSDDSDEPKKHSIFDIPDEGPQYVSMYDKVKARSCKNMQKQEEEKKIKAKFSQLKLSRAKREEKKRSSQSWDEDSADSDADMMGSDMDDQQMEVGGSDADADQQATSEDRQRRRQEQLQQLQKERHRRHERRHRRHRNRSHNHEAEGDDIRRRRKDSKNNSSSSSDNELNDDDDDHEGQSSQRVNVSNIGVDEAQHSNRQYHHHHNSERRERHRRSSGGGGSSQQRRRRQHSRGKDTSACRGSDSDSAPSLLSYHRNRMNELCDEESSDQSALNKARAKISSRKNSRSRVAFDSSDDGGTGETMTNSAVPNNAHPTPATPATVVDKSAELPANSDAKVECSENTKLTTIKIEPEDEMPKAESTAAIVDDIAPPNASNPIKEKPKKSEKINKFEPLLVDIKVEPLDTTYNYNADTPNTLATTTKSTEEELGTDSLKKKHKKSKKRSKAHSVDSVNELSAQANAIKSSGNASNAMVLTTAECKKSSGPDSVSATLETTPAATTEDVKHDVVPPVSSIATAAVASSIVENKNTSQTERKRHNSRKDKKRVKSDEEHDRAREERYQLKKLKRQAKLSSVSSSIEIPVDQPSLKLSTSTTTISYSDTPTPGSDTQTAPSSSASAKEEPVKYDGGKMEDIFGPISDDDSLPQSKSLRTIGVVAPAAKDLTAPILSPTAMPITPGKDWPLNWSTNVSNKIKDNHIAELSVKSGKPSATSHSKSNDIGKHPNNPLGVNRSSSVDSGHSNSISSKSESKQHHREKKRDKKRKEREKAQLQSPDAADDDSVDLDAAGRALEAQLMESCTEQDNAKPDDVAIVQRPPSPPTSSMSAAVKSSRSTSNSTNNCEAKTPASAASSSSIASSKDVFRFSDGDDSVDVANKPADPNASSVAASERHRDKRKKKKRSKDEKRHHHHSSSASTLRDAIANSGSSAAPTQPPSTPTSSNTAAPPQPTTPTTPITSTNKAVAIPPALAKPLSIDITNAHNSIAMNQPLNKASPSLPCLIDESPSAIVAAMLRANTIRTLNLISPIPNTPTGPKPQSRLPGTNDSRREPRNLSECSEYNNASSAVQTISFSTPLKSMPSIDLTTAADDELVTKPLPPQPMASPIIVPTSSQLQSAVEIATIVAPPEKSSAIAGLSSSCNSTTEEKSRVVISQEETEDAVAALLGESFGSGAPDYGDLFEPDPIVDEQTSAVPHDVPTEEVDNSSAVIPEEEAEEMRKAVQSLNTEELDMKPDTPQSDADLLIDTDTEEANSEESAIGDSTLNMSSIGGAVSATAAAVKSIIKDVLPAAAAKSVITSTASATFSSALPASTTIVTAVAAPKPIASTANMGSVTKVPSITPKLEPPVIVQSTAIMTPSKPTIIVQPAMSGAAYGVKTMQSASSTGQQQHRAMGAAESRQVPPSIQIPESTAASKSPYPSVLLSPRAANLSDLRSQQQQQQQQQQHSPKTTNVAYPSSAAVIIRNNAGRSSGAQHSPVISAATQMSPTGSQRPLSNRMPITPALAPISTKPLQPTHTVLPQPSVAQTSTIVANKSGSTATSVASVTQSSAGPAQYTASATTTVSNSKLSAAGGASNATANAVARNKIDANKTHPSSADASVARSANEASAAVVAAAVSPPFRPNVSNVQITLKSQNPATMPKRQQQPPLSQPQPQSTSSQLPVASIAQHQQTTSLPKPHLATNANSSKSNIVLSTTKSTSTMSNIMSNAQAKGQPLGNSMPLLTDPVAPVVNVVNAPQKSVISMPFLNIEAVNVSTHNSVKTTTTTTTTSSSVIKPKTELSQTAGSQPTKSLLTEENVIRLTAAPMAATNSLSTLIVAGDAHREEQDSKEDSDYWSAKEVNIDSVIKKVDALCSGEESEETASTTSSNKEELSMQATDSAALSAAKPPVVVAKPVANAAAKTDAPVLSKLATATPTTTIIAPVVAENPEGDAECDEGVTVEANAKPPAVNVPSVVATSPAASAIQQTTPSRRGRLVRGRKASPVTLADSKPNNPAATAGSADSGATTIATTPTRRGAAAIAAAAVAVANSPPAVAPLAGKPAAGKRGRAASRLPAAGAQSKTTIATAGASVSAAAAASVQHSEPFASIAASPMTPLSDMRSTNRKPRNTNSESDIYEFHEDSGEDTAANTTPSSGHQPLSAVNKATVAPPSQPTQLPAHAQSSITVADSSALESSRPRLIMNTNTTTTKSLATASHAPVVGVGGDVASHQSQSQPPQPKTTKPEDNTVLTVNPGYVPASNSPAIVYSAPKPATAVPTVNETLAPQQMLPAITPQSPAEPPKALAASPTPPHVAAAQPSSTAVRAVDSPPVITDTHVTGPQREEFTSVNAALAAAAQAAANVRKSRRLIERDGSRSTIDDIIDDVVKNSSSPQQQQQLQQQQKQMQSMQSQSGSAPVQTVLTSSSALTPPTQAPVQAIASVPVTAPVTVATVVTSPSSAALSSPRRSGRITLAPTAPSSVSSVQTKLNAAAATVTTPAATTTITNTTTSTTTPMLMTASVADARKSPRTNRRVAKQQPATETSSSAADITAATATNIATGDEPNKVVVVVEATKPVAVVVPELPKDVAAAPAANIRLVQLESPADGQSQLKPPTQPIQQQQTAPNTTASTTIAAQNKQQGNSTVQLPREPLALIDPVTGELTVVQQSNEGHYVPVAGSLSHINITKMSIVNSAGVPMVKSTVPHSSANTMAAATSVVMSQQQMPTTIATGASVISSQKQQQQLHAQPTTTATIVNVPMPQSHHPQLPQHQPQQQQSSMVKQRATHPLKAHVLSAQPQQQQSQQQAQQQQQSVSHMPLANLTKPQVTLQQHQPIVLTSTTPAATSHHLSQQQHQSQQPQSVLVQHHNMQKSSHVQKQQQPQQQHQQQQQSVQMVTKVVHTTGAAGGKQQHQQQLQQSHMTFTPMPVVSAVQTSAATTASTVSSAVANNTTQLLMSQALHVQVGGGPVGRVGSPGVQTHSPRMGHNLSVQQQQQQQQQQHQQQLHVKPLQQPQQQQQPLHLHKNAIPSQQQQQQQQMPINIAGNATQQTPTVQMQPQTHLIMPPSPLIIQSTSNVAGKHHQQQTQQQSQPPPANAGAQFQTSVVQAAGKMVQQQQHQMLPNHMQQHKQLPQQQTPVLMQGIPQHLLPQQPAKALQQQQQQAAVIIAKQQTVNVSVAHQNLQQQQPQQHIGLKLQPQPTAQILKIPQHIPMQHHQQQQPQPQQQQQPQQSPQFMSNMSVPTHLISHPQMKNPMQQHAHSAGSKQPPAMQHQQQHVIQVSAAQSQQQSQPGRSASLQHQMQNQKQQQQLQQHQQMHQHMQQLHQQQHAVTSKQQQQQLHHQQILTAGVAVPSPPLKHQPQQQQQQQPAQQQSHPAQPQTHPLHPMGSAAAAQQPIVVSGVAGSSARVTMPTNSPQGLGRAPILTPGLPVGSFDSLSSDVCLSGGGFVHRCHSPPPAHQLQQQFSTLNSQQQQQQQAPQLTQSDPSVAYQSTNLTMQQQQPRIGPGPGQLSQQQPSAASAAPPPPAPSAQSQLPPREHFMYQHQHQYMRAQDMIGQTARSPYIQQRSIIPGCPDAKDLSADADERPATSPPMELRRVATTTAAAAAMRGSSAAPGAAAAAAVGNNSAPVSHSLHSPQDQRATDSPQVAQVYVHGTQQRFDATGRPMPLPVPVPVPVPTGATTGRPPSSGPSSAATTAAAAEPPPAHRPQPPTAHGTYAMQTPAAVGVGGLSTPIVPVPVQQPPPHLPLHLQQQQQQHAHHQQQPPAAVGGGGVSVVVSQHQQQPMHHIQQSHIAQPVQQPAHSQHPQPIQLVVQQPSAAPPVGTPLPTPPPPVVVLAPPTTSAPATTMTQHMHPNKVAIEHHREMELRELQQQQQLMQQMQQQQQLQHLTGPNSVAVPQPNAATPGNNPPIAVGLTNNAAAPGTSGAAAANQPPPLPATAASTANTSQVVATIAPPQHSLLQPPMMPIVQQIGQLPQPQPQQQPQPPLQSPAAPATDSLLMLLRRYPVVWQGMLALKTDYAAVQMHFVYGNPFVADGSLPMNLDGSTPPVRIAQRMRLEQTQLEGVARKMQTVAEHCMLLALPCGRDHNDVLQQSTNLQTGFITYLQQKQAAGIINLPAINMPAMPTDSDQAAYVAHIFPSCEFANEKFNVIAPDLLQRVADIAHLLIVIATV